MLNDSKAQRLQGQRGEQLVAYYLQERGYTIHALNYKKRFGEVDIIAQKHTTIAFIEVKTRTKASHCTSELVNSSKQRKIILVAKEYISRQRTTACSYRFDVALIDESDQTTPKITYIENAFYGSEWQD